MTRRSGALLVLAGAIYSAAGMISIALLLNAATNLASGMMSMQQSMFQAMFQSMFHFTTNQEVTVNDRTVKVENQNININGNAPQFEADNTLIYILVFPTVLMWSLGFIFLIFGNSMDAKTAQKTGPPSPAKE